MSYSSGRRELSEAFSDFLSGCAKTVLGLGGIATLISVGLLIFICFVAGDAPAKSADAVANVILMQKVLIAGVIGLAVGSGYLYWGEDLLGAIQLMGAGALYFAPLYLPMVLGGKPITEPIEKALGALQTGGTILGCIAVPILVIDISQRTRQRIKVGVKADQLKYGKGIKEEPDKQNVFFGKCWQLPYCRKFVRERCPIFHAKRTCWKELVGCMCEETVIRNAMENKPISKDALIAAQAIPRNHKLSTGQKRERCRNCVIYNEHQRHKYKLAVPSTVLGFALVYIAFRGPLLDATGSLIQHFESVIRGVTLNTVGGITTPAFFVEVLLVTFFIVGLSYAMKVLEFLIFKVKI